jgi:hypothetical protein
MASNCAKLACAKGLKTRKNMSNWVRAHGPDKVPNNDFEKVRNCWQGRSLSDPVSCNSQVALENAAVAQQNAVVAKQNAAVAQNNATVAVALANGKYRNVNNVLARGNVLAKNGTVKAKGSKFPRQKNLLKTLTAKNAAWRRSKTSKNQVREILGENPSWWQ